MSAQLKDAFAEAVPPETLDALDALAAPLSREQLLWTSGYLAGLAAARAAAGAPDSRQPAASKAPEESRWLILYATETGNSRRIAQALEAEMRQAGIATEVVDLRDYEPKALRRAQQATFVVATHGLGDPPEGTEEFFDYWLGDRAPRLETLRYSVLALGDSTYVEFCGIGRRWDERLEALGAARVHERVDCDVDFETPATAWRNGLVETLRKETRREPLTLVSDSPGRAPHAVAAPSFTRDAPFAAPIVVNQRITGRASTKDVRHLELVLEGSGLTYEPGDALGIWPRNPPSQVDALLAVSRMDGDAPVEVGGETLPLREALATRLEITQLGRATVAAYAAQCAAPELERLLDNTADLQRYLVTRQAVDLIAEHPAKLEPQQLATILRGITPRLYSIASSLAANEDEAHLCISLVQYERCGLPRWGATSAFVASGATEARVYIEPNDRFRLPKDGATPIVMIGAGTGVAPYRAFLQQRKLDGARGGHWLIYGDRTLRNDFLYQIEWLRALREGSLTRLDVAFSRDQAEKLYVQQRVLEHGRELYDWLERGAHVYVCGDAEQMAPAVHEALRGAIEQGSGRSADAAEEYLAALKRDKRYQRDVY